MNTAINYDAHRATPDARYGYQVFTIGSFSFTRDEYFVRVSYPKGTYVSDVGLFLRAMMRDVAWGFFYGWVNFDDVFGTVNHYGSVDVFVGSYNAGYQAGRHRFLRTLRRQQALRLLPRDVVGLDQCRL